MTDVRVHGSIFFLLKKFINFDLSPYAWEDINVEVNQPPSFSVTENYAIEQLNPILEKASQLKGISKNDLMERFGKYLVNDLFALYRDYIKPEWRTYEVILNTETVMHGAVRKLNSTANPPILHVSQVSETLLIIDYHSHRKMASLALGIIEGIAEYYGESTKVRITPMTDENDERVQIRLDFLTRSSKAPGAGTAANAGASNKAVGNFRK